MKVLKIEFKPLEPYFFGNERSLSYRGVNAKVQMKAASYFSKSERVPLQSTLFGALRYLGIQEKHANFQLSSVDKENIGCYSFKLNGKEQTFGKIKRISSLYLTDAEGNVYIPIPADQENFLKEDKTRTYMGIKQFKNVSVETHNGTRYLPEVNMKQGFENGYLRVKDGKCVSSSEIFQSVVRTSNAVNETKDAFFKKEYCYMPKHSFLIFAEVDDAFPEIKDKYVKLGQGKTAFAVTVTELKNQKYQQEELKQLNISSSFPTAAKKVVLLSDTYVKDVRQLYSYCYFVHSDIREYRAMETVYDAKCQRQRYKKQEVLLRLLKAGSVFWVKPECEEKFKELLEDKQAQIAGFNLYIMGGNK